MNVRECPTCSTHIGICDRCGGDHPQFGPPPPWNGSLNSREDIRICGDCYKALCVLVWAFYGRVYPEKEG